MGFLQDFCSVFPLDKAVLEQCQPFSCGDKDLDDFFLNDADNYNRQLLGKSFCYRLNDDTSVIVCAFTFLTVDAYNTEATRRYYHTNDFKDLFSTEEQEKESIGMSPEKELKTRLMYYDLMLLSDKT
ncbi:hypothetical protein FACS189430_05950 [Bacteroidia bacterium]|nr:hypothetical protein FACS189430_05950 [Bacteroidia bacterium]